MFAFLSGRQRTKYSLRQRKLSFRLSVIENKFITKNFSDQQAQTIEDLVTQKVMNGRYIINDIIMEPIK